MTAALFLNPVDACAIANGITTAVGFGDIDLTCPTCEGECVVEPIRIVDYHETGLRCPRCDGTGVAVPVSGWYLIGATTELPDHGVVGDITVVSVVPRGHVPDYDVPDDEFDLAPGRGWMTNDEWRHKFDDINKQTPPRDLTIGGLVAYAHIEILPVVDLPYYGSEDRIMVASPAGGAIFTKIGTGTAHWNPDPMHEDIIDLSYGTYRPGGYAAMVTCHGYKSLTLPRPANAPDHPCFEEIQL